MKAVLPIPCWLKRSARVDIAQLCHGIRPVIRTELSAPRDNAAVHRWIARLGLYSVSDGDGFVCISRIPYLARGVLALDRSVANHTFELGIRLGYPFCCCRRAAEIGEEGLDAAALAFLPDHFSGRFKLIDPSRYLEGKAFISHIPCSPRCQASLRMATVLYQRCCAKRRLSLLRDLSPF